MGRFTRFTAKNQANDRPGSVQTLGPSVLDAVAFAAATERALAHGDQRAIVLIELDADHAVKVAAETRILHAIRPDDRLGRLADGRLAVLTAMDGAARVAMRLGDRLREPFNVGAEHVRLSPQVGVGYAYADVVTAEAILREAENSPRY